MEVSKATRLFDAALLLVKPDGTRYTTETLKADVLRAISDDAARALYRLKKKGS